MPLLSFADSSRASGVIPSLGVGIAATYSQAITVSSNGVPTLLNPMDRAAVIGDQALTDTSAIQTTPVSGRRDSNAANGNFPIIVPDSTAKVTDGEPGSVVHSRFLILATGARPDATRVSAAINTPAMLKTVYNLPSSGGAGAIAIVDPYNYTTALKDFNTFAKMYSLPQETSSNATSSSNQKFEVFYATGRAPMSGGSYIASWNMEAALDIEWSHAIAPGAKIYLVEAASPAIRDMLYAVQVASLLPGVREVSMSWGGEEQSEEAEFDSCFTTPNVTYFASGGDEDDEMEYPSASPNVVSVGGTTINRSDTGTFSSETAWSDAGCGISQYEPRPAFQDVIEHDVGNFRGANDVAFDADPNTGVEIYDSTPLYGESGWTTVGGTSLAAPCWAGVANLASVDNGVAASSQAENERIYANLGDATTFRDITSGADGDVDAEDGWDEPTGVGSPLGLVGK